MQDRGIERFLDAHEVDFERAYREIKAGNKKTHWIWYIFPNVLGLGSSDVSQFYAIKSLEEAEEYYKNPVLRKHLHLMCNALLRLRQDDPVMVMNSAVDADKLQSCMTLFANVTGKKIFYNVLRKFFDGKPDTKTLKTLNRWRNLPNV